MKLEDINPIQMADEAAQRGDGFTKEEWDTMPYCYIGECYKQCYELRLIKKGRVSEYGVRGVYECTGCNYAYPPFSNPEELSESDIKKISEEIEDGEEESDREWYGEGND